MSEQKLKFSQAGPGEAEFLEAQLLRSLGELLPQSSNLGFARVVRDESAQIIGGVTGSTSYGWLLVKIIWIKEGFRGRGIGRRLMRDIEAWAGESDCHSAWLETSNPEAKTLYEKLGYEEFAILSNEGLSSLNHRRWFMKKSLTVDL